MANFGAFGPSHAAATMAQARRSSGFGNGLLGAPNFRTVTLSPDGTAHLGRVTNSRVLMGGAGTVLSFGKARNAIKFLKWNAIQTITRNATTLETPTQANIVTKVGATAIAMSDEFGNWTIFNYADSTVFAGLLVANNLSELTATAAAARTSIYAAPFDALAYNGMQVNGSMEVSQEKGTNLITPNGSVIDGVSFFYTGTMVCTAQQVTDAPPGYSKSIKIAVTTAQVSLGSADYAFFRIPIEGVRVARLQLGTGTAQFFSKGIWVKAHRTGTYSGGFSNGAQARSYPFSFTINVADTWEYKTVTALGDTSGTWATDTTVGMYIYIAMAAGSTLVNTANAWAAGLAIGTTGTINGVAATSDTFQISGLALLPGIELPSASRAPFIMRPFDQELQLCQRYYEKSYNYATLPGTASTAAGEAFVIVGANTGVIGTDTSFKVRKRATPTLTSYSPNTGAAGKILDNVNGSDLTFTSFGLGENGFTWYAAPSPSSSQVSINWVADARL